jgi:UDP-glucose 4-epimerase
LGTKNLIEVMAKYDCYKLVFSSSATIYGSTTSFKISEDHNINPQNPYGHTKAAVEDFLIDLYSSNNKWSFAILRYFNPVGAHSSGHIGEDPFGVPNNLFPFISQVAIGRLEKLLVFGNDWPTTDGTGIRDYIHVIDLAQGHISALEKLLENNKQILKLNLGTGKGYSVLEVLETFSKVSGIDIPYEVTNRRSGDTAKNVADPSLAQKILGWESKRTLFEMCKDSWNWQTKNPNGYY